MAAADAYGEALAKAMRRRTFTLAATARGVDRAGARSMTPERLQAIIDGVPPVSFEARALESVLRVPPPPQSSDPASERSR